MAEQTRSRKRKTAEQVEKMAEQVEMPIGRDVSKLIEKMNGISNGDKEVFLWELVFNARRGLYKMRVEGLYHRDFYHDPRGFFIDIIPDKINHTLSIVDNGIGMTEDCLKKILSTQRTVKKYNDTIDKLVKKEIDVNEFYKIDSDVGLGFYAAFMVADSVEITTKHYGGDMKAHMVGDKVQITTTPYGGDKQCTLFSSPKVNPVFFVESSTVSGPPWGTKVTLQLNKDHWEYLDECRLKVLIDKYTFAMCPYPISIRVNNNNIIQRVADVEDRKEGMKLMKRKLEPLRKLFTKVLGEFRSPVKRVIVSDRIYDLASNVSRDCKTLEINPWFMELLRQDAELNPEDEDVVGMIRAHYIIGEALIGKHNMKHKSIHNPL